VTARASKSISKSPTVNLVCGAAAALRGAGLTVQRVNKVEEGRPAVPDRIKNVERARIINTTAGAQSVKDAYTVRREALQHRVTYFTTLAAARAAVEAHKAADQTGVYRLQTLHERFDAEG